MITNALATIARAPQRPNFAIPKALLSFRVLPCVCASWLQAKPGIGENRLTNMQSIWLKLCGVPLYDLVITAMVIQVRS